ncbi:hypothetical protein Slin15195_G081840 [Septoria linicola]|uniref:Uncharacterized protein n=1 Tax=Septoria linicola TaxID=215465 RepID=A0A9Q9AYJ2_9PEZI|nr:hypothetical protein Slin15195_G081840 [Septoria linicola]
MSSTLDVNKKSFTIALLGSWSSLTDLSRKGDAHKIEALANNISGAEDFSCECDKMLESLEVVGEKRKELAKNGFTHIAMGGAAATATREEKVNVAIRYLVELSADLLAAKRAGQVDVVKEIGERLIGEEEFELKVQAKIAESGGI